jgi:hypothetical protein
MAREELALEDAIQGIRKGVRNWKKPRMVRPERFELPT